MQQFLLLLRFYKQLYVLLFSGQLKYPWEVCVPLNTFYFFLDVRTLGVCDDSLDNMIISVTQYNVRYIVILSCIMCNCVSIVSVHYRINLLLLCC